MIALGCHHEYCKICWDQYLTTKITDDGEAESIRCPESKCNIVVDDDTIIALVKNENVLEKYKHLMVNSFVKVISAVFSIEINLWGESRTLGRNKHIFLGSVKITHTHNLQTSWKI